MAVNKQREIDRQNIKLTSSTCSESCGDGQNSLFRVIIRSLGDEKCATHNAKYQFFYKGCLSCAKCFQKQLNIDHRNLSKTDQVKLTHMYNLETLLNHPILFLTDEKTLIQKPLELIELMLHSYKQIYAKKSDFKIQRQLLISFVDRLKSRISSLCDQLLNNFQQIQQNTEKQLDLRQQMKKMNKMYEEQLLELLQLKYSNSTQDKKDQLQSLLQEYSQSNQNPFPKMFDNLESLMKKLQESPTINWKQLTQLYTVVTDEQLWRTDQIVTNYYQITKPSLITATMILQSDIISLQGQYQLQYKQNQMVLKLGDRIISQLIIQVDSLYHLSNYKLVGINYDKIQIINYFDQLTIEEQFEVSGCTDILPFKDCLVVVSNNKLIKIDLNDKSQEILGYNFRDLRYLKENPYCFECVNSHGLRVHWNLKNNKSNVVSSSSQFI